MSSYPWTHLAFGIDLGYDYLELNTDDDVFFAKEKELKAIGCKFIYYGLHEDEQGIAIIVKESDNTPDGAIIELGDTLPTIGVEFKYKLLEASKILNIEYKPTWILCCSYG